MTPLPSVHTAERAGATTGVRVRDSVGRVLALRVAVVRRGRLLEERVFRRRSGSSRISIGSSERATLTLPAEGVPDLALVFELRRSLFTLHLGELAGKVDCEGVVRDFDELRRRRSVVLSLGTRGRIVAGSTVILFHVVELPPTPPRARLPIAVLGRDSLFDFPTTLIAAFAFLLHFGMVGVLYSDWVDPVIDDELSIAGVVDGVRAPLPPPLETTEEDTAPGRAASKSCASCKTDRARRAAGGPSSESRSAALVGQLESILMQTLPALGSGAPATREVLAGSEVPTGALDAAAESASGVSEPGAFVFGPSGGPLRPGEPGRLGSLGRAGRDHVGELGSAVAVRGPVARTDVMPPEQTGRIDDAPRVVAGLRAGFRQCYIRELDRYPDAQGSVRLTLEVGPNGEVMRASAVASGALSSSLTTCLRSRAAAAQFAAPDGGRALVIVPIILRNQR